MLCWCSCAVIRCYWRGVLCWCWCSAEGTRRGRVGVGVGLRNVINTPPQHLQPQPHVTVAAKAAAISTAWQRPFPATSSHAVIAAIGQSSGQTPPQHPTQQRHVTPPPSQQPPRSLAPCIKCSKNFNNSPQPVTAHHYSVAIIGYVCYLS